MTSPSKILLLALFVAAAVAYFGDKIIAVADGQKQVVQNTGNDMVYAKTNRAEFGGEIRVSINRDGHYWATLDVNGTPVRFVVDTGASHISLSYEDAEAAGLDPAGLAFDRAFRTANGISYKAMVKLDQISLDSIEVTGISASVSQQGAMNVSLLGMNFLNKLSSFKIENRDLILKP
ncbi:MAG TPA: TIGR02281 family clan AA aspartic protease [Sphingomonadales bacterium]|nr:TIGR02281 family clan AA aspartic protease [Sphingomonadales bacterium]